MVGKKEVTKFFNNALDESKTIKSMGSGLMGESFMVSLMQKMPINDLEKFRYLINKIIKRKKIEIANQK